MQQEDIDSRIRLHLQPEQLRIEDVIRSQRSLERRLEEYTTTLRSVTHKCDECMQFVRDQMATMLRLAETQVWEPPQPSPSLDPSAISPRQGVNLQLNFQGQGQVGVMNPTAAIEGVAPAQPLSSN